MCSFSLDCLYLDLSLKLCIYTILIRSSYESWANWKILSQSLISRFSTDQTKNRSGINNCNWSKNRGGIKACKNFISWAELGFTVLNKIKRIKLYMTRLTLFMVCQHFKYEPNKYFSFQNRCVYFYVIASVLKEKVSHEMVSWDHPLITCRTHIYEIHIYTSSFFVIMKWYLSLWLNYFTLNLFINRT